MRNLFILLFVVVLGASCVPNKKIVYLQKGNELREDFPKDTVLRTYDLADYEYRIQPEDILSVRVRSLTEEEYDIFFFDRGATSGNQGNISLSGYLVDKSGNIQFPEVGKVNVAGLTLHEIEDKIQLLAAQYVEEPTVNVRILNFRVTVLGEVNAEGTINTFNNRTTIMEAIGLAGGLSELADRAEVKLIRQSGGETKVAYVNLLEEDLMSSPYFFVNQNDIIIVPPLRQRPFRRYFGQNIGLFLSSISTLLLVLNLINNQ